MTRPAQHLTGGADNLVISLRVLLLARTVSRMIGVGGVIRVTGQRIRTDGRVAGQENVTVTAGENDRLTLDPVGVDPVGADPVSADPVGVDRVGGDPVGVDRGGGEPVGGGAGGGGVDRGGVDRVGVDPVSADPVSVDQMSAERTRTVRSLSAEERLWAGNRRRATRTRSFSMTSSREILIEARALN